MIKKRFISMLVLLMTAVTGAWAETITVVWDSSTNSFDNRVQYSYGPTYDEEDQDWVLMEEGTFTTNLGNFTQIQISGGYVENYGGAAGWNGNTWTGNASSVYMNTFVTSNHGTNHFTITFTIEPPTVAVSGITLDKTSASMTVGGDALMLTATVAPDDATDKTVTWTTSDASVATVANGVVTAVGAGTATITATATNGTADTSDDKTATCEVTVSPAGYSVALKEGTDDAANWQGKAGEGEYQALPLEGVAANTAVSVKYSGTKKVKSVKAVKKAPAGPVTYTELNGGEVLHVGDIINLSEEISFNHGNYYMGSYGSPYTVVRADLTIDEYEEIVVNEKADGKYYVIRPTMGNYYHFERALGVTDKSDGILVTYNGKSGKWSDYTFTVHEP